jgi:hypothetical protein
VAVHRAGSPVDREVVLGVTRVTNRPGNTLDQLVGCVPVQQVLRVDFLVHQDWASVEPWVGMVWNNDDS